MSEPIPATVISCRGPRAAERALLAEVERLSPPGLADLAAPLRIIVPSSSLRRHLERRLVRHFGRALLGVAVQTLTRAALEVLERAGDHPTLGEATFQVLVRREARTEPLLRRELENLEDGYGVVAGAVRDLLDAGFEPPHREVVEDKLATLAGVVTPRRLERVAVLARLAARVADDLEGLGVCRLAQAPQRATGLLRARGGALLPARAVVVHGFADATGVASDLIEALLVVLGGSLILDRPPDPLDPGRDDPGAVFVERFAGRFGGFARRGGPEPGEPGVVDAMVAPTPEAEVRHVAARIRALLDGGAVPEGIAVVARDLAALASLLRRHFDRLGIPLSGEGAALPGGEAWRRARTLARLLRTAGQATAELWLEARPAADGHHELLLALRSLGVVRLAEAAALVARELPGAGVELPLPAAWVPDEPARARVLAVTRLREEGRRAAAPLRWLEEWPGRATAFAHLGRTMGLMARLGWEPEGEVAAAVTGTLQRVASELPAGFELDREEWIEEAARSLEHAGAVRLGGRGGGVQVLSAMEARARTFDHVFLVRLNRGLFPRVVQEDALLPDTVRGHLAAEVLREFPVRARGLDEERYLFAQLAAAAPRVTVSWSASSDGAKAAPSPFVVRLCRQERVAFSPRSEVLDPPPAGEEDPLAPRPAFEHALLGADRCGHGDLALLLATARGEGRRRAALAAADGAPWAAARVRVLEEIEAVAPGAGPGPWAGLVGPTAWGGRLPSVTALEQIATCPFQSLLVRRLRVEPPTDPRHGLPDAGAAGLGLLVHSVLERVVDDVLGCRGGSLAELATRAPQPVPWPAEDELERLLLEEAEALAGVLGLVGPVPTALLAARARPFLEVARSAGWGGAGELPAVLGAEVSGEAHLDGLPEPLRFRADRVDRTGDGLLLVDYKTGRPPSAAKGEEKRREHLLRKVRRGGALQGPAYAHAASPLPVEGRYLYLRPEIGGPEASREVAAPAGDAELGAAFASAVAVIVAAWRSGALFPRVEEADGATPAACRWCPVRQACLRDDSGFRSRLASWLRGVGGGEPEVVRSASELWWLGRERPEEGP